MENNNETFKKNIKKLVKLTNENEQPSEAFVDSLIDSVIDELKTPRSDTQPKQEASTIKPSFRRIFAIAAGLAVAAGILTLIVTDQANKKRSTPDKSGIARVDTPASGMVELPLVIPAPIVEGTPPSLQGIENLEPFSTKPRPPFMVPKGVTNIALNAKVTCSDQDMTDPLDKIVDGDASGIDNSWVELGLFEQSITIDLGKEHEIYAIVVWHYHKQARVYNDVVVQIAKDPDFTDGTETLFNNDTGNVHGQGQGTDKKYIEKNEGRVIAAKGKIGKYVRLFSNGNNDNELNHYTEVQVFGKPAE